MQKITNYFKSAISEAKKVSWPTKKETKSYTILVIGVSLVLAFIIMALDKIFALGLTFIINK